MEDELYKSAKSRAYKALGWIMIIALIAIGVGSLSAGKSKIIAAKLTFLKNLLYLRITTTNNNNHVINAI